jgi:hypothetical protein
VQIWKVKAHFHRRAKWRIILRQQSLTYISPAHWSTERLIHRNKVDRIAHRKAAIQALNYDRVLSTLCWSLGAREKLHVPIRWLESVRGFLF